MSDVINEEERHEAATEEPTTVGCPSLGLGKLPGGFDGVEPREKPIDPTAPEMEKASKFGLLANGVQMVRYAGGPTVTLIGKRDRGPFERQEGRTGKVIYKVTVSRETHTATVDVDGATKISLVGTSLGLLECGALSMLNCIIKYNARQQRNKRARLNRRKAEKLADGSARAGEEVAK